MKRTTIAPEYISRAGYDPNKSITNATLECKDDKTKKSIIPLLKEFPEYNAEWTFVITNVGVIIFTNPNDSTNIYYDILNEEKEEDEEEDTLNSVSPDTSILEKYTYVNNPFNYRIINFDNGEFIPYRSIIKGDDIFIRINADYIILNNNSDIKENEIYVNRIYPNKEGWFELKRNDSITSIYFYYKQSFNLKGNVDIPSGSSIISNFINTEQNFCISKNFSGSFGFNCANKTGYLEVR